MFKRILKIFICHIARGRSQIMTFKNGIQQLKKHFEVNTGVLFSTQFQPFSPLEKRQEQVLLQRNPRSLGYCQTAYFHFPEPTCMLKASLNFPTTRNLNNIKRSILMGYNGGKKMDTFVTNNLCTSLSPPNPT